MGAAQTGFSAHMRGGSPSAANPAGFPNAEAASIRGF